MRILVICVLLSFAAPAIASEWQYEKRDGYVIAWKAYPYYGAPVQPLPREIPADTWQRFLDWLRTQENSCADNLPAPYFNPNNACFELNNRR